jgi:hypothetical protein
MFYKMIKHECITIHPCDSYAYFIVQAFFVDHPKPY